MSEVGRTEHDQGVVQLTLQSGSGNPMGESTLHALHEQLDTLGDARALVFDGGEGKLFSGGFNLPEIVHFEREKLAGFFSHFMDLLDRIMRLECPSIVAIHSHALAGGFIMSLAFDLRVVQRGTYKLGLNEVDLGVMIPAGTEVLLTARTSAQHALSLGMQGKLIGPDEAARIGYAECVADDARAHALALAKQLASKPGRGANLTRQRAGAALAERVANAERTHQVAFLDSWHDPTSRRCMLAVAERLTKR